MRYPVRSEADAFRFALAVIAVAALSVLVGWLAAPLAGLIAFLAIGLLALGVYMRARGDERSMPLREAAHGPHPHAGSPDVHHVLVVANAPLSGEGLRRRITPVDGREVEIDVLAPVLTSRVHLAVTDIDRELVQTRARLDRSLAWLREAGIAAHGEVGDQDLTASMADQLREYGADEVIVVTAAGAENEGWQARAELQRLRAELDVPVTHTLAR